MTVALYAGRFDPVTNGHLDIVERAARLFDQVVIGVAASRSTIFSLEERIEMFEQAVAAIGLTNVRTTAISGLTVDEAKAQGAQILVRGLRAGDFAYEFDMALMNRNMAPDIESVYLMTADRNDQRQSVARPHRPDAHRRPSRGPRGAGHRRAA